MTGKQPHAGDALTKAIRVFFRSHGFFQPHTVPESHPLHGAYSTYCHFSATEGYGSGDWLTRRGVSDAVDAVCATAPDSPGAKQLREKMAPFIAGLPTADDLIVQLRQAAANDRIVIEDGFTGRNKGTVLSIAKDAHRAHNPQVLSILHRLYFEVTGERVDLTRPSLFSLDALDDFFRTQCHAHQGFYASTSQDELALKGRFIEVRGR